ncbi:hypothetical protein [Streptomyces sp. NPDC055709]
MRSTTPLLSVERAAAAVVLLTGVASTVLVVTHGTRAPSTPAWLLPALVLLGAVLPLFVVRMRQLSHRGVLLAFAPAAACHAAVLGASGGDWQLRILLGLSIGVSIIVCVRVTLLRAEASQDRPRNRF